MTSTPVVQSYVTHGEEGFFVSTIERDSSAAEHAPRYFETTVWRVDPKTRDREMPFIHQADSARGNLSVHFHICEKLYVAGEAGLP